NMVSNNIAGFNAGSGISLSTAANQNIITNNTANSNDGNGISLSSASNNNNITNNNASLNTNHGISISFSSNNIIMNNIANFNNGDGISLTSSNGNSITGNIANFNMGNGISLTRSNDNIITGNTASFNCGQGIFLSPDSIRNIINNNTTISNGACGGGSGILSAGSSSGSEGGGGVITNENFENIEFQERIDQDIHIGPNVYRFNTLKVVKEIGFYAKTNEGLVAAKVELLKRRPKLAASDAPKPVYRYFNVWIGTSGYGASSKIEDRYIVFSVPDDWLRDNDAESIKLMMFMDNAWMDLKAEKIGEGTYRAYTPEFSGFAIVGVVRTPLGTPSPVMTTPDPTAEPEKKVSLFAIIMVFSALCAGFLLGRWKK
ncbi:MAG TPA: PGF-pre-PGF domain-containing protein, partial [candidate division Zixibacteria bacterium]|nr:PGF-pre-PGF domain-containing protein [candidate division Zixibacteria bacterium]